MTNIFETINKDINSILKAQKIHAQIKSKLSEKLVKMNEEDFIDMDAFATSSDGSTIKFIENVEVKVTKLHRKGDLSTDILGADMLYELEDKKFLLVQYKNATNESQIKCDKQQILEIKDTCAKRCKIHGVPHYYCGAWYKLCRKEGSRFLRACDALNVFGSADSRAYSKFSETISESTFFRQFAECKIGSPLEFQDIDSALAFINTSDLAFHVRQSGSFGPTNTPKRSYGR